MTEAEWNASTDSESMLAFLEGIQPERKLRLFAVACCRNILHLIPSQAGRRLVEIAERYADGLATDEELTAADKEHSFAPPDTSFPVNDPKMVAAGSYAMEAVEQISRHTKAYYSQLQVRFVSLYPGWEAAAGAANMASAASAAAVALNTPEWVSSQNSESAAQAILLREIFASQPFRQSKVKKSLLTWNKGAVVALAQAIYDEKAFDRMPMLADALEDAGCNNADILNHCRQPGEHVRGCWVVDLLLGKS